MFEEDIFKLEGWIWKNGFSGYDPYDFRELLIHNKFLKSRIRDSILVWIDDLFPPLTRRLFNIEPKENAKAVGLLFTAYINLYDVFQERTYLARAKECKEWLLDNLSDGYSGKGWGYPFDWQSKILIPKGTPSAVVTANIGGGFWREYEVTGEENSLKVCEDICRFFVDELNIDRIGNNKICFSYTPLDKFHVHNANLYVAEFLIKVGEELGNNEFIDYGKEAADYSLSEQNSDGSVYYWGNIDSHYKPEHMDHYHTGFELRSLYSIAKITDEKKYLSGFERYYGFYKRNFFSKNGFIKHTPKSKYPIDIHSCAESILCNSYIKDRFNKDFVEKLIGRVNSIMLTTEGWYIYKVGRVMGFEIKSKIPYLRWGQSWMLRALSEYLLRINGK
ncbi:hypothetical protein GF319_10180 [Candidatus Bathyarchaeota archaeon]|nr:hypothetical protein [Candidatus Bathyarchaeota archaeon]